ncbi:MAG: (d)CMP kinase [Clostridia bacterium]|nr:(d)CMP kinase [Clostridia bacterium]MBR5544947.1 (d)CMP kinase [Clostridia bacterium]
MINVAIDGPAGAGKSTVARAAAQKLGYIYVDTGALYRAVGVYCLRKGIVTTDAEGVGAILNEIAVELKFIDGVQHVFLNGDDVSTEIRLPEASMAASNVSAIPSVRAFLFDLQRDIAAKNNCIMDGRDIGTVVLPNAQVKIFLTADDTERAMRRYKELQEKGSTITYQEVLDDLRVRDYNDSHREIAPLKPAEDSVIVNTTNYTLEESIDKIVKTVEEKL